MKRLITFCIVLTAIALVTVPAFAEVQNVKVSGDINSAGVLREDYDLLSNNQTAVGDQENTNLLFTQARVKIDADLTDNVSTTVRFLSEYDWNTEDNTGRTDAADNVDLDLANVTLKEVFLAPLTVTVGRQELRYGNGLIIGDPDTNTTDADANFTAGDLSLRKSFDAIKAVLDYDPLVIDLIAAKIQEDAADNDDENLYGINAAYDIGNYDAEVEGYWFLNRDDDETATTTGQDIHTFGIRGSLKPIDNLNLLVEGAWQRGDFTKHSATKRDQAAYAYQVAADYSLPDVMWEPIVKLGWTRYSGEETGNTGDHEAWLPLYEDQTHGVVANHILGGVNGGQNSNADILNIGVAAVPLEDLTVSLDFYNFWLDEKLVAGNNDLASTGSALAWTNLTAGSYRMKTDDNLGYEIDLALNYDYTEDVKMGLSASWFTPGDAFDGASGANSNDETAIQMLATLDVAF